MINNAPLRKLKHKGFTIEGYSRAAVQSYWRIPELKIGFDLGGQPWDFMGTPIWFISHTHLDHVAALPVYVARRRMMKMEPPTLYLPEHAVDPVKHILRLFSRLDRSRMPCEIVAIRPGDEVELSREHLVTAVPTHHTVPSLGFVVWERRKKLRTEFQNLPGEQIRDLRLVYQRAQLYGTNWSGIAGLIFGLDLKHQPGIGVKAWGDEPLGPTGQLLPSGTASQYGPSGWEFTLGDNPISGKYNVQLLGPTGEPISPIVEIEL